jgi:N6-adenosine-specific RNA methylase IME4
MTDELFPHHDQLTDAGSVKRDMIALTVPGMAHFAGSGPPGEICGACAHWRGSCLEYARRMPSATTIPVPPETSACRHWSKAPDGRVARPFTLAVDDDFITAPIKNNQLVRDLTALAESNYRAGAILSDVPWPFRVRSELGKHRSAERHYPTMALNEIAALGPLIRAIAADDSILAFWVTQPQLLAAGPIMESWGYRYRTILFTWAKITSTGAAATGLGYWTRAGSELCLLGVRGRPKRLAKNVPQLLLAPRQSHSEKPRVIHDRITSLVGGPYLELFARERRLGWQTLGTLEGIKP